MNHVQFKIEFIFEGIEDIKKGQGIRASGNPDEYGIPSFQQIVLLNRISYFICDQCFYNLIVREWILSEQMIYGVESEVNHRPQAGCEFVLSALFEGKPPASRGGWCPL